MSTKDKTRQKLVGSMRKTKSVAGIGPDNVETEAAATAVGAAGSAVKSSKSATVNADAYQSGRRIWPD